MKYLSYIKEFKHFPSEIFIFFTMFLFQTFLKTKKSEQTTIFIFNTFFSFFLSAKNLCLPQTSLVSAARPQVSTGRETETDPGQN